jgi:hypothetical protein
MLLALEWWRLFLALMVYLSLLLALKWWRLLLGSIVVSLKWSGVVEVVDGL